MALGTLTGANAVILLQIANLFPTPIPLQGFAADDVTDMPEIKPAEVLMGVDGILSGGYVAVPIPQTFTLQGNSPSNALFDAWWVNQKIIRDVYIATATIILPGIGAKYSLTPGYLTGYKPMSDIKKLAQPRKFEITWGDMVPFALYAAAQSF